jgi:dTDP-4-amino-4,6-dideoxygalactose transaminase
MIPYGRQNVNQDDINSVIDFLKSDFLTQGPQVSLFEKAIENYCGAKSAVAVNSAISALHIACLALDVGPDD